MIHIKQEKKPKMTDNNHPGNHLLSIQVQRHSRGRNITDKMETGRGEPSVAAVLCRLPNTCTNERIEES